MKMYLSSYELGDETNKLIDMRPDNRTVGYIFNAMDRREPDSAKKLERMKRNMEDLDALGFESFNLDLRDFFGRQKKLREVVGGLGAVWGSGGNVFVLRQAFKLSGFDEILLELNEQEELPVWCL